MGVKFYDIFYLPELLKRNLTYLSVSLTLNFFRNFEYFKNYSAFNILGDLRM